jgi:hypothetical protein
MVEVQIARDLAVDAVEEVQELARAVPRQARADHLAIEQIERREEGRGAVAVVIVRLPGGDARAQGQQGNAIGGSRSREWGARRVS